MESSKHTYLYRRLTARCDPAVILIDGVSGPSFLMSRSLRTDEAFPTTMYLLGSILAFVAAEKWCSST